jgi:hypothetical protein
MVEKTMRGLVSTSSLLFAEGSQIKNKFPQRVKELLPECNYNVRMHMPVVVIHKL